LFTAGKSFIIRQRFNKRTPISAATGSQPTAHPAAATLLPLTTRSPAATCSLPGTGSQPATYSIR
jgi:hypothetical protein